MTYTHRLTETETACGVTLADVARVLPLALLIDGGTAIVLPAETSPALAGSVARVAFSGAAVRFAGFNALGLPVYRPEISRDAYGNAEIRCGAPGVWRYGQHFERLPESQTAPVLYCAACLGLGTIIAPAVPR